MRKGLLALLVVSLLLMGAQTALASDFVRSQDGCFIPQEYKGDVSSIVGAFRARMAELRGAMADLRGTGNTEAISDIHLQRFELHQEKLQLMAPYVPDEMQEGFLGRSLGRHRMNSAGKGLPWPN